MVRLEKIIVIRGEAGRCGSVWLERWLRRNVELALCFWSAGASLSNTCSVGSLSLARYSCASDTPVACLRLLSSRSFNGNTHSLLLVPVIARSTPTSKKKEKKIPSQVGPRDTLDLPVSSRMSRLVLEKYMINTFLFPLQQKNASCIVLVVNHMNTNEGTKERAILSHSSAATCLCVCCSTFHCTWHFGRGANAFIKKLPSAKMCRTGRRASKWFTSPFSLFLSDGYWLMVDGEDDRRDPEDAGERYGARKKCSSFPLSVQVEWNFNCSIVLC